MAERDRLRDLLRQAGFETDAAFLAFVEAETGHRVHYTTLSRAAKREELPAWLLLALRQTIRLRRLVDGLDGEDLDRLERFSHVLRRVGRHRRVENLLAIMEDEVAARSQRGDAPPDFEDGERPREDAAS